MIRLSRFMIGVISIGAGIGLLLAAAFGIARDTAVSSVKNELDKNSSVINDIRYYGGLGQQTYDVLAIAAPLIEVANYLDLAYQSAAVGGSSTEGREKILQQLGLFDQRLALAVQAIDLSSHGLRTVRDQAGQLAHAGDIATASYRFMEDSEVESLDNLLEQTKQEMQVFVTIHNELSDVMLPLSAVSIGFDETLRLLDNASRDTNWVISGFAGGLRAILLPLSNQINGVYLFVQTHNDRIEQILAFVDHVQNAAIPYQSIREVTGWLPGRQLLFELGKDPSTVLLISMVTILIVGWSWFAVNLFDHPARKPSRRNTG